MLFNSLQFIIFLPIVVAFYFAIPSRFRWILLLIASYYFYMCWNYKYVVLIAITTTVNYLAGIGIGHTKKKFLRITYLTTGLVVSLGILFFFKYFNFFGNSINAIFEKMNILSRVPAYNVLLPVGISFFTFQTLSYTIDVYNGKQDVEYHFGIFALYVSFFPQLVAGPIERSTNLLPQFFEKHKFNYLNIRDGIAIMIWGFFKKVVIADRLSEYVNIVYNSPQDHAGWQNILGTIFFSFQIYCDFSGYSDIAIGAALLLGFRLMKNFRRPYLASSIREFWARWHISLSTWFRDYLYIPLGGNRVVKWRHYYNLFITFLVSGLWHGANWTFVAWGALHGFYLVFAIWINTIRNNINKKIYGENPGKIYNVVQVVVTVFLAWFAWIFFRANSIDDAFLIMKNMFVFKEGAEINLFKFNADFYISIVCIFILLFIEILEERIGLWEKLKTSAKTIKWLIIIVLSLAIFILGKWDSVDFLYFQF